MDPTRRNTSARNYSPGAHVPAPGGYVRVRTPVSRGGWPATLERHALSEHGVASVVHASYGQYCGRSRGVLEKRCAFVDEKNLHMLFSAKHTVFSTEICEYTPKTTHFVCKNTSPVKCCFFFFFYSFIDEQTRHRLYSLFGKK